MAAMATTANMATTAIMANTTPSRGMVMCVVDGRERLKNRDRDRIFQRCRRDHNRIQDARVCVGRTNLALGDYAVRCCV